jgi:hypothetical protein
VDDERVSTQQTMAFDEEQDVVLKERIQSRANFAIAAADRSLVESVVVVVVVEEN